MTARLIAVCTGRPERRGTSGAADPFDRPWESAIWKTAVAAPVRVDALGLDGDVQADPRVHGGVEKAVLAYAVSHYATAWREVFGEELLPGAFGENLAIDGLDETSVAIGDVFAIGAARLQVSQPRGPCWKLVRKFRREDLVERVIETGFTGWYLRVLEAGTVEAGLPVALVDRPHPALTIAVVNRVLHHRPLDRGAAAALAACAELAPTMRRQIEAKLAAP
ncbi:MAG TPA: MOSC domain-containing protein [Planctomycetota bacterium]